MSKLYRRLMLDDLKQRGWETLPFFTASSSEPCHIVYWRDFESHLTRAFPIPWSDFESASALFAQNDDYYELAIAVREVMDCEYNSVGEYARNNLIRELAGAVKSLQGYSSWAAQGYGKQRRLQILLHCYPIETESRTSLRPRVIECDDPVVSFTQIMRLSRQILRADRLRYPEWFEKSPRERYRSDLMPDFIIRAEESSSAAMG